MAGSVREDGGQEIPGRGRPVKPGIQASTSARPCSPKRARRRLSGPPLVVRTTFPVPSDFEELGILVAILVDGRHIAALMPLDGAGLMEVEVPSELVDELGKGGVTRERPRAQDDPRRDAADGVAKNRDRAAPTRKGGADDPV